MPAIDRPGNARSERTRAALLAAARALLENDGAAALTMTAVAERAEVSRQAVYLHFGSRSELVSALFDHIAEQEGLAASVEGLRRAPDAASALDAWAHHLADYHPRVIAVDLALQRVEDTDPDAARHRARVSAAQERICREVITRIAEERRLAAGWSVDTATDLLFGLIATEMVDRLLCRRGWTTTQLGDRLSLLLRSTLLADDPTPAPRARSSSHEPR